MTAVGDRIGSIRVVEALAEGGMGEVFVGFDEKLQREVALKALRGDRLEGDQRQRMLYEARVLSRLDHPNVCRIYDLVESDGRDFLVLERVVGTSLRELLDAAPGRPLDRGLEVAEQIVGALAAAHEKGIVHRDLKPQNVMCGEGGVVKVLDFGLARAFGLEAPEVSAGTEAPSAPDAGWLPSGYVETQQGTLVGTASWMSPEQARGEVATAASDMYSLGLLLQEISTGRPAFERDLPYRVLVVKAAEGDTLPVEGLEADLTALILRLKAMAPEARPSAAEVLERLAWIRARPRRQRRRLAAVALLLGLALFTAKYTFDLRRERAAAVAARIESERVVTFLEDLFEVSDPGEARGNTVTAREVLDRGVAELAGGLDDQPRVRARLLDSAGSVYQKLGLYEQALPLLEEALALRRESLEEPSPEVASSLHRLAALQADRSRHELAEPLFEQALAMWEALRSEARAEEAAAADLRLAETLFAFGRMRGSQRRFDEAEELQRRGLALREARPETPGEDLASSLAALGSIHGARGETAAAGEYFERSLEIRERVLPPDHPDLANSLMGLAAVYNNQDRHAEAEPSLRRALEIQEKTLGPDHPRLALGLRNLAALGMNLGHLEEAEASARRSLAILERHFPPEDPNIARGLQLLVGTLVAQGREAEAEPFARREREIRAATFGPEHLAEIESLRAAADRAADTGGDLPRAAELLGRARSLAEERLAADLESRDDRRLLAAILTRLGGLQSQLDQLSAADESWSRCTELAGELAKLPADLEARALLATCWGYLGRLDKARPLAVAVITDGWADPSFLAQWADEEVARQALARRR